jgi:hypothetical protein
MIKKICHLTYVNKHSIVYWNKVCDPDIWMLQGIKAVKNILVAGVSEITPISKNVIYPWIHLTLTLKRTLYP